MFEFSFSPYCVPHSFSAVGSELNALFNRIIKGKNLYTVSELASRVNDTFKVVHERAVVAQLLNKSTALSEALEEFEDVSAFADPAIVQLIAEAQEAQVAQFSTEFKSARKVLLFPCVHPITRRPYLCLALVFLKKAELGLFDFEVKTGENVDHSIPSLVSLPEPVVINSSFDSDFDEWPADAVLPQAPTSVPPEVKEEEESPQEPLSITPPLEEAPCTSRAKKRKTETVAQSVPLDLSARPLEHNMFAPTHSTPVGVIRGGAARRRAHSKRAKGALSAFLKKLIKEL